MISRRVICLLAAVLSTSFLVAAAPSELDRAAVAMTGTTAAFTQRFTPRGFKNSQNESGVVTFGALPMMRWEYSRPEKKLFVFDGTRSWFYLPADKQVTVSELDEAKRRELPFLFLGNQKERDRFFVVTETNSGGMTTAALESRTPGMIRKVLITIRTATHAIEKVQYSDRDGNQTLFELSGYRKVTTPAQTFQFTVPAGVQVVRQ